MPDMPHPLPLDDIAPGEKRQFRYAVSETYLGDAVEIPVTVINGEQDGYRAYGQRWMADAEGAE